MNHCMAVGVTRVSLLLMVACCCSTASTAWAQTKWKFNTSGTWSDSTKWDPSIVPDSPTTAVIVDLAGIDYVVILDDSRSIDSLTIDSANATVQHLGGTLSVAGSIVVQNGRFELAGGTVLGGTLDGSKTDFLAGTLDNVSVTGGLTLDQFGGYVVLAGGSGVAGDLSLNDSSTLYLDQDFQIVSGQTATLGDALGVTYGQIYNYPGRTLTIDNGGTIQFNYGFLENQSEVINNGQLLASTPSGGAISNGNLTNNGLISADASVFSISSNLTNSATGIIRSTSGSNVTLGGQWQNQGVIEVDSTSQLTLGGQFTTAGIGTLNIAGGGRVSITGLLDNSAANFVGGSEWSLDGGTIAGGTLVGNGIKYNFGTLDNVSVTGGLVLDQFGGYVVLSSGSTVAGDITVTDDASVLYLDQDFNVTNGQTISLGDVTGATYGQIYNYAGRTLTIDNGGTIQFNYGFLDNQAEVVNNGRLLASTANGGDVYNGNLTNNGLISADASVFSISSNLTNSATGIIESKSGSNVTLGGQWQNQGVINVDSSSQITLGGQFTTAGIGTLNIASGGKVSIAGLMDNSAANFVGGSEWSLDGGTIAGGTLIGNDIKYNFGTLDNVSVTGDLVVDQFGGYVVLLGGSTVAGNIAVTDNASTLYLDQDFNIANGQTVTLGDAAGVTYGQLQNYAGRTFTIDNGGLLQINYGTVYNEGDFVNNGQVTASTASGGTFLGGTLVNNGTISSNASSLYILSNFTNSVGGLIESKTGSNVTIEDQWTNQGAIEVDSLSQLTLDGQFTTADIGTINVAQGGKVTIAGSLDNNAAVFAGGAGWYLEGGTISGGTLVGNGVQYAFGTLDNVSVTGDLTLDQFGSFVVLTGGSTVSGDLLVREQAATLNVEQSFNLASGHSLLLGAPGTNNAGAVQAASNQTFGIDSGAVLGGNGSLYSDAAVVSVDGTVRPGHSIGQLSFAGTANVVLGIDSVLEIELAGLNAGEFDTIIANSMTLGGTLQVSLLNGFVLGDAMAFDFMSIGTGGGTFNGLAQNDIVASFGGYDLRIDYAAGDGNDVRLLSSVTAIPEPSALAVLSLAGLAITYRRRNRSRTSLLKSMV